MMDTSPLNLDLLSRELAETQQYLENAPQLIRRSLRTSKDLSSQQVDPTPAAGSNSAKSYVSVHNASSYSSPESRDERINQLLEDYQKRKEVTTELFHQIQLFNSPSKTDLLSDNVPIIAETESSNLNMDQSDSEVYNDSLYFASDINYQNTLPLPKKDDQFEDKSLTLMINSPGTQKKRSQSAGRLFSSLQRLSKPRNRFAKDDNTIEKRPSKVLPASYINTRIDSMYSKHQQQLRNREKMKYEYERLALMECTFVPQISSSAKKMKDQPVTNNDNSNLSSSSASLSNRLHEEAAVRRKQLQWLGKQLQEESLAECTFQPTLNGKKSVDSHVPIHQRVVDLQRQKQRNLHQLRDNIEKEQTDLSFKPKIAPRSSSLAKERNSKYSADDSLLPSFRSITSTQDAIKELTQSDHSNSVVNRLLSEGKRLQRRKQQLFMEREEEMFNECQKTSMSKGTQILARKSPLVKVDFDTRQKYHEDRLYRNHQKQLEAQQVQQDRWFKPHIQSTQTEKILSQARPDLLDEDQISRNNRLWKIDSEEKAVKMKELQDEFYGQISFSPQINPISKLFGRKSSIDDLYENQTGKHSINLLKLKVEAECNQECTFMPKINEYSKEIASEKDDSYDILYNRYYENHKTQGFAESPTELHTDKKSRGIYSLGRINFQQPEKMASEIQLHRLEKENRRQQELILREVEELQDCTFHPDLHQNQSFAIITSQNGESESPVVIKGFARHMELKELSQKLKKEQLDREHAAFHVTKVDEYRRPEDGSTIVQPFCLTSAEKKALQDRKANLRRYHK